MLSITALQTSLLFMSAFLAIAQAVTPSSSNSSPALPLNSRQRRHHARRAAGHRRTRRTSCSPSSQQTHSSHAQNKTSPGEAKVSSYISHTSSAIPSTTFGLSSANLAMNGIAFGFLPDEGDAGGSRTTMAQINQAMGAKSAAYGWYAQAHSGTLFDGSQLLVMMDDVKACNCVFQPAIMPVGGWKGLTKKDNSQAVAIAKVLKKFTDQGIPVWLRFAHEMNYYQTDGTYQGNAADFKAGWAAVAAACKQIAPQVKMWWTPNVAADSSYRAYEPEDMSTVDLVGVDFYPKSLKKGNEFVNTMKAFHDRYAVNGRKFAIGETGLGFAGSPQDRLSWLKQIMSCKSQLPQMIAAAWFNFEKGYDYRVVIPKSSSGGITALTKTYLNI